MKTKVLPSRLGRLTDKYAAMHLLENTHQNQGGGIQVKKVENRRSNQDKN